MAGHPADGGLESKVIPAVNEGVFAVAFIGS
jgi:hypothetical protein